MPLSSARSTTNQTEQNLSNSGDGSPVSLAGISQGKKSTLNLTLADYGAIGAGADLAKAALDSAADANQRALIAVQNTSQSVIDKTLKIASQNQVGEGAQFQQLLLYGGLIAAAAFVLVRFAK